MVGIYWSINIIITIINLIILIIISNLYMKSHRALRSKISASLLLFAILLLIQSLLTTLTYIRFSNYYGPEIAIPLIPINMLGLLAMLILLWLSKQ
ncbi:MAG: hypothetical protein ACP5GU_03205 [Thermoprotei archaeon]|jgi:uncharacterized membrane protein